MTRNDVIAEYVKERFPEILTTIDFAVFNFKMACKSSVDSFEKAIKKIDFSHLQKTVDDWNRRANDGKID